MIQHTFASIIALWPSVSDLAGDLDEKLDTIRKWRQRDSIPSEKWLALIDAGQRRGIAITAYQLAEIADGRSTAA